MGKRSNKTGLREVNPTDVWRKQQRLKEKKRNRNERKRVREEASLRRNPDAVKTEMSKLQHLALMGQMDVKARKRLDHLEETWEAIKQKAKSEINSEKLRIGITQEEGCAIERRDESMDEADDDSDEDTDEDDEQSTDFPTLQPSDPPPLPEARPSLQAAEEILSKYASSFAAPEPAPAAPSCSSSSSSSSAESSLSYHALGLATLASLRIPATHPPPSMPYPPFFSAGGAFPTRHPPYLPPGFPPPPPILSASLTLPAPTASPGDVVIPPLPREPPPPSAVIDSNNPPPLPPGPPPAASKPRPVAAVVRNPVPLIAKAPLTRHPAYSPSPVVHRQQPQTPVSAAASPHPPQAAPEAETTSKVSALFVPTQLRVQHKHQPLPPKGLMTSKQLSSINTVTSLSTGRTGIAGRSLQSDRGKESDATKHFDKVFDDFLKEVNDF